MNRKYLFGICCFVLISLIGLFSALKDIEEKTRQNALGSYAFETTKNTLHNLSKIQITDAENREINLYYDAGVWRFEEAADYLVNAYAIENFYNMIQQSVLLENVKKMPTDKNRINIKTFDSSGKILDNVYLFGENNSFLSYALNNQTYKISHGEKFSAEPAAWLPSPLFQVNIDLIDGINLNGDYISKDKLAELLPISESMQKFLGTLGYLDYEGIMPSDLFKNEYKPDQSKEIIIYLRGGLNYRLLLFRDAENYYLSITPEREIIAAARIDEAIAIKKMYYDGWIFIIPAEQGSALFEAESK